MGARPTVKVNSQGVMSGILLLLTVLVSSFLSLQVCSLRVFYVFCPTSLEAAVYILPCASPSL